MQQTEWLFSSHSRLEQAIRARLQEFKSVWQRGNDAVLFEELCFCLLTPQSRARNADAAIRELKESNLLYGGTPEQIAPILKGKVRFHNQKAARIVEAREKFLASGMRKSLNHLETLGNAEKREWLVQNVNGYGYKEAAHFLRNMGFCEGIAILDRHILKNLARLKVIREAPKTLTKKAYMEIEGKMKSFCSENRISMEALDLVLWAEETGEIFK